MDIHVQMSSLCQIFGDEIEDHKRKVDTNRLVSEIHQIWKDLYIVVGFSKYLSTVGRKSTSSQSNH